MGTSENLAAAFAGESQANRRYLAFAKKADEEGYAQVAKLFRTAAASETVHALNHLKVMQGVADTAANLRAAIDGEVFEHENMYPGFIKAAQVEGNQQAVTTFSSANAAEKVHSSLYKKALDNIGDNEETDYYVCQVCGYTFEGEAPDVCPICGTKRENFKLIK